LSVVRDFKTEIADDGGGVDLLPSIGGDHSIQFTVYRRTPHGRQAGWIIGHFKRRLQEQVFYEAWEEDRLWAQSAQ
jgi:hypothetical protein